MTRTDYSQFALIVALLAPLLHYRYFLADPRWGGIEDVETYEIAKNIAEHGQFGEAWNIMKTGPTACVAPVFPFVVAIIHRVSNGDLRILLLTSLLIAVLSWTATLLLLPFLTHRLLGSPWPGVSGALAGLLPLFPVAANSEVQLASLFLVLFCIAATYVERASVMGAAAGLLALVHPASVAAAVPLWLLHRRPHWRHSVSFAFVFVLTVAPWMVRNYCVMGGWFFIRDNFGLELYTGNRDDAPFTQVEGIALRSKWPHPNQNSEETLTLKTMGELRYMQSRGTIARDWIMSHPVVFIRLVALRILAWFAPWRTDLTPYPLVSAAVSLLGVGGLLLMPTKPRWTLLTAMVLFACPYFLVQAAFRYRTPTLWIALIGCGHLATYLYGRITVRATSIVTPCA